VGGGNGDRLPALAAELAQLKVDAIVSQGTQATDAARRAITTIPIVFFGGRRSDWFRSREQPRSTGGNVTGLTDIAPEIAGKRLELFREAVPVSLGLPFCGTLQTLRRRRK
jgi:putative ABC transport system substrate-binding protein